jgi:hypothetical protein
VLHHISRAKSNGPDILRELKKNNKLIEAHFEAKDMNGDTPLIVACEGM